ncbi:MAG: hypothetical protein FWF00_02855 [Endomicrobia bacterium]|nr:hypothetical protein [Endomicrobiia bacterium]MCL2506614.1 hypothetical protein [Endomicrobiia bacterium]
MFKKLKIKTLAVMVFSFCFYGGLFATNVNNWADLNNAVNSKDTTITFTTTTLQFSNKLSTVNYSNSINFYGDVTLDGNGLCRAFYFNDAPFINTAVVFNSDINFVNFTATTGVVLSQLIGGVILSSNSTVSFAGAVNFSGNTADFCGGAIYSDMSIMNFNTNNKNIIFDSNRSNFEKGGAIYIIRSVSSFSQSLMNFSTVNGDIIFSSNCAGYGGGAIYASKSTMSFTATNGDIIFSSNTSTSSAGGGRGGAAYADQSIMNFNVSTGNIIFNSNASFSHGGAIAAEQSKIDFNAINGNIIFDSNMSNLDGGAIHASQSTMSFRATNGDIVFNSNVSLSHGGAIYNTDNSTITFSNANVIFSSNAAISGGAIRNYDNAKMTFKDANVIFSNNAAGVYGGAISNYGSISFIGSTVIFSSNSARAIYNSNYGATITFINANVTFNGNSGAICNYYHSRILFTESTVTFSGNTAAYGGAIWNYGSGDIVSGSLITFSNSNVIFDGNVALSSGGAIFNQYRSTITFTGANVIFSGNTADNGGAIYSNGTGILNSIINFTNSNVIFDGNIAASSGGAIYNNNHSNSRINFETASGITITFINNYAAFGNDIYNDGIINISGAGNIIFGGGIEGAGTINKSGTGNVYFEAGSKNDFGILNLTGGNVHFSTSAKINSMNVGAAGTLSLDVDFIGSLTSVLYFDNITISTTNSKLNINDISAGAVSQGAERAIFYSNTQNSGTFGAGNIYDLSSGSTTSYKLSWVSGLYDGGYSWMGLLTYGSLGQWNTFAAGYKAVTSGNTINLTSNITATSGDENPFGLPGYNNITIDGLGNTIDADGRAGLGFIFDGSSITFRDINFEKFITTATYGGVISSSNSIVNLAGAITFSSNTALTAGGAIYAAYASGMIFDAAEDDIIFNSNRADIFGGAIYSQSSAMSFNATNGNIIFSSNNANYGGGAIYAAQSTISFTTDGNIIFSLNTSSSGGAISAQQSIMNFNVSTGNIIFNSNVSFSSGSAIYAAYGSMMSFNATNGNIEFNSNTAGYSYYGGAIFVNQSMLSFNTIYGNTIFSSNSAGAGGAIYLQSSVVNFTAGGNLIFNSNIANNFGYGGGIYAWQSTMTFTAYNIIFNSNSANGNGGAIYAMYSTMSFVSTGGNIEFNSNTTSYGEGGAIDAQNSIMNFTTDGNIIFSSNSATYGSGGGAIFSVVSKMNFAVSTGDIIFNSNSARQGGAIDAQNSIMNFTTDGNIIFNSNSVTYGNGGAISASFSTMSFKVTDGNIIFSSNSANYVGGAIYNTANSKIIFTDSNVIFAGNIAVSSGGAIYNEGELYFIGGAAEFKNNNAAQGKDIYNTGTINIDGGVLRFHSEISGNGTINVLNGGVLKLMDNAQLSVGDIFVSSTGVLSAQNGTFDVITVDNLTLYGLLELDASQTENDRVNVANTANINGRLNVKTGLGVYNDVQLEIMNYGSLIGGFSEVSAGNLDYLTSYEHDKLVLTLNSTGTAAPVFSAVSNLNSNASAAAKALDKLINTESYDSPIMQVANVINEMESESAKAQAVHKLAGHFLANVIRNAAADSPNNEIYDKIKNNGEGHGSWAQLKGGVETFNSDENSPYHYKDHSVGVMFGYDKYSEQNNIIYGVYARFNKDNISYGDSDNKAEGVKKGLGFYGGYLKEKYELKAMLLGSYDQFETQRDVRIGHLGGIARADINAFTINADAEAALRYAVKEDLAVKPYVGFEMENTNYGSFKERDASGVNLEVDGGTYLRTAVRAGVGGEYDNKKLNAYTRLEGKVITSGREPVTSNSFENTSVIFDSVGSEEGALQIGIGGGAELKLTGNISAFANIQTYFAARYSNVYGNLGVRYMFGKNRE